MRVRFLLITSLSALLVACGGDDLQPVRSAGPALGKRVVFTAELVQPDRHVFLADTGQPQAFFQVTEGLLGGGRSIGQVFGIGHPRYLSYVEQRGTDTNHQVIDLEAIRRDFGRTPFVSGAVPRVSDDGGTLAALFHQTSGNGTFPTVALRALSDPQGIYHLNHPTPPTPTQAQTLRIAPDSTRVVWSDDGRLWQRQITAGMASPALLLETTAGVIRHLAFTPDSSAVVWAEGDSIRQRRFAEATATTLSPTLAAGEVIRDFRLSADGTRLVYRATDSTGRGRLFAVDRASPGAATELTPAWAEVFGPNSTDPQFDAAYTSSGWQLRPDGAQIAFVSGGGTSGQTRGLYTVEVATPGAATLRSVATGSYVGHLGYADAGASLVWTATPNGTLVDSRLWRGPSQGPAAPVPLFGPLTLGADDAIFGMLICGDDTAVVRWIDWVAGAVSTGGTAPRHSADLYMVRTDGGATATLLTPANTVVEDFACVE